MSKMQGLLYDPSSPTHQDRLYQAYAELREKCPVHHVDAMQEYVVSRYADVRKVILDPKTFSSVGATSSPMAAAPMLPTADDPAHAAQRRLIVRAFTASAVKKIEPIAQHMMNVIVDDMLAGEGAGDLISLVSYPFPMQVLGHLFGVAPDDANFRGWADALFAATSDPTGAAMPRAMQALGELGQYVIGKAAARRASLERGEEIPEDILTALVRPNAEGDTLSEQEFVIASAMILTAGHETTTKSIGNTIHLLLTHPDQLAELRADPKLIDAVVEESLRFESPAQGLWRRVAEDTCLAGVDLKAGERVWMAFGSANRDGAVFDQPDQFNIHRPKEEVQRHFAFGFGIHNCIGAGIARMETRIAVMTLIERLPNLRLDPSNRPQRSSLHWMRGFETLPVLWG